MKSLTWPDGTPKSQNNAFDWRGTSKWMDEFLAEIKRSEQNGSAGRAAAKVHPQVTAYSPAQIAAEAIESAQSGV